jgi:hypothetical protein
MSDKALAATSNMAALLKAARPRWAVLSWFFMIFSLAAHLTFASFNSLMN